MPPRIPTQSLLQAQFASLASSNGSAAAHVASPLERALLACQSATFPSASRSFSATTTSRGIPRNVTFAKRRYFRWLQRQGKGLKHHKSGTTNYMGLGEPVRLRPFLSNPTFTSYPVLSEDAREMIYRRVVEGEEPLMVVSAELGVDHRRVAAVVRMKAIEKEWERQGQKLAKPYSRAIMEMVPTHSYPTEEDDEPTLPLEPINEIHVHGYTMQQLFVPTSESRHFTREDAAKAFHPKMLSADDRMPHKVLVEHLRRVKDGMRERESREAFVEAARAEEQALNDRVQATKEKEKRITTTISTDRFEFRIKKMTVDDVGKDGRSRRGVGWRYGFPFEDRKKNQIKIPTKID